jgi:alpha-methylacyl-CoA racemase
MRGINGDVTPVRAVLSGIRIVSTALNIPGPVAAQVLTSLGARVLSIKPPSGDPLMRMAPDWYSALHQGQTEMLLDLRRAQDIDSLHREVHESDLLLTSQRRATLERLGLSWAGLQSRHPNASHVEIVGSSGADLDHPGHDLTYLAPTGMLRPPIMPTTLLVDLAGADRAVTAALALIVERQRFGRAGHEELSLVQVAADYARPLRHGLTKSMGVLGGGFAGYGLYPTADGWVAVAALEPTFQERLRAALGVTQLDAEDLRHCFATRTTDAWSAIAREHGIPLEGVVLDGELERRDAKGPPPRGTTRNPA